MATVARKTNGANRSNGQASSKASESPRINLVACRAALMAIIAKIGGGEGDRDALSAGEHHTASVTVLAEINGQRFQQSWDSTLDVGPDSVRASAVGAPQADVIAWLLRRVNAATKAKLLREMAEEYAANGNDFGVTEAERGEVEESLKRLRQKVDQPVRGSVRVNYAAAAAPLKIIG